MKIAINARLLLKNKLEGIGWFTMETMKRITQNHPEHEFIFIFDRAYSDEYIFSPNIKPVIIGPPARHPFLFYLWFDYSIPFILKKYKADIFLSPDGYLSLRTQVPQLAVIHDISFWHRPDDLPRLQAWYYNYFFPQFAKKASRIATVSDYSRMDISDTFGVDKSKIDVVFNGIKGAMKPVSLHEQNLVRHEYTAGFPFFLYVGALHPRKNIAGLLNAYELFRKQSAVQVKLLIVGGVMHKTGEVFNILENMYYRDDVIFTGRVTETELHKIYPSALALTYIPFFEGFGLPIVEAMCAGVPVICSETTSMPEVGGDAVFYVNPERIEQIAAAMSEIATNQDLRTKMIERGMKQKSKFSWDITAQLLWESIEKVM